MCECDAIHRVNFNAGLLASDAAQEQLRPTLLYKPRLSIDGDQWCALYGENLQDGVAGFGNSPDAACRAFDRAWCECLLKKEG